MVQLKMGSPSGRRMLATILLALASAAALLAPSTAAAQSGNPGQAGDPDIKVLPVVSGPAQVGATVTTEGAQWRPPNAVPSWHWQRCGIAQPADDGGEDFDDSGCQDIAGATATSYTITQADEGRYLRVRLMIRHGSGSAEAYSATSAQVAAAPRQPAPATPVGESSPIATPPAGGLLPERITRPARLMNPFPLVRIRGRTTLRGARITLLTVRSPKGARITLICRGRNCPARRWARTAAATRILRFERHLRAGTRLVIRVTKPGRIGKHTTIFIRRNRAPLRSDRCLYPGRSRPVACPAA